jgi:hypothetical protein
LRVSAYVRDGAAAEFDPSSTLSEHFLIDPTYLLGLQGVFPVSAKT